VDTFPRVENIISDSLNKGILKVYETKFGVISKNLFDSERHVSSKSTWSLQFTSPAFPSINEITSYLLFSDTVLLLAFTASANGHFPQDGAGKEIVGNLENFVESPSG
jgi:hypothetical protein